MTSKRCFPGWEFIRALLQVKQVIFWVEAPDLSRGRTPRSRGSIRVNDDRALALAYAPSAHPMR